MRTIESDTADLPSVVDSYRAKARSAVVAVDFSEPGNPR